MKNSTKNSTSYFARQKNYEVQECSLCKQNTKWQYVDFELSEQREVTSKSLNFLLRHREVLVLDIIFLVEWGISDLLEGEKSEIHWLINSELNKTRKIKANISKQEDWTIEELQQNKELISKSDKGGVIVLLMKYDYWQTF